MTFFNNEKAHDCRLSSYFYQSQIISLVYQTFFCKIVLVLMIKFIFDTPSLKLCPKRFDCLFLSPFLHIFICISCVNAANQIGITIMKFNGVNKILLCNWP